MIARSTRARTLNRPQTQPARVLVALTATEARLLERSTVLFAAAVAPYMPGVNEAGSPLRSARRKLGQAMRLAGGPVAEVDGLDGTTAERPRARVARTGARRRPVVAKHL
jgi:hypothetical protein